MSLVRAPASGSARERAVRRSGERAGAGARCPVPRVPGAPGAGAEPRWKRCAESGVRSAAGRRRAPAGSPGCGGREERGLCRAGGAEVSRAGGEGGSASLRPRPSRWPCHMPAVEQHPALCREPVRHRLLLCRDTLTVVTDTQTQAQIDTGTATRAQACALHVPKGRAKPKLSCCPYPERGSQLRRHPRTASNKRREAGQTARMQLGKSRDARDPRGMCSARPAMSAFPDVLQGSRLQNLSSKNTGQDTEADTALPAEEMGERLVLKIVCPLLSLLLVAIKSSRTPGAATLKMCRVLPILIKTLNGGHRPGHAHTGAAQGLSEPGAPRRAPLLPESNLLPDEMLPSPASKP
ncbi:uncharacterized protein LOC143694068 [Agelaius phoeniceus]|uniref:uncharacterized protein LOC143694068 n=1 Tax=Agelaius phoeniceus TaxID=39638 RepID=UPI0040551782